MIAFRRPPQWTRRTWLARNAAFLAAARTWSGRRANPFSGGRLRRPDVTQTARLAAHVLPLEPGRFETLARQAVEAARAEGARYADTRLTRTVQHHYNFAVGPAAFVRDLEVVGVGVRVLVDGGYWGFAASPLSTQDEVVRLVRLAVAQAKVNAKGPPRTVELGQMPAVTGRWVTPVTTDPFAISIEEKADSIEDWWQLSQRYNAPILPEYSYLHFARQERTVATSDGSCVSQTRYESGGLILVGGPQNKISLQGIDVCGKGWELFEEAKIPDQLAAAREHLMARAAVGAKPARLGRYTLVCDGRLMGKILSQTFGLATQLDRALGYEANAGGTSFLNDPLGMLGTLQIAASLVTITANRSAPAQLATVRWDDEGVEPQEATLVKQGVLTDFQTTREQAAWLAPFYQKAGKPVRSHGYAGAEDGLYITTQHMPNLALEPGPATVSLSDMIANVTDGILISDAFDEFSVSGGIRTDQQARNGYFGGEMREIKNGRLGRWLAGGAVLFNTIELWKHVIALGGAGTAGIFNSTAFNEGSNLGRKFSKVSEVKGQPPQLTSYSVRGVAATIADQALIDLRRKA